MYVCICYIKQTGSHIDGQADYCLKGLKAMLSAGYIPLLNTEVVCSSRMLGAYLPDYMVSHSKRQHSSEQYIFKFDFYKLHPLFFTFQH